uniref:NADH-ubiquinone oxidoreductase chain 5 n=1 Tax=Teslasena femoralis TaxID=1622175 RepID=A0A0H3UL68_9COLE|nr:NADH dehydrogenase subunit 5 [Teslasena femoralis]
MILSICKKYFYLMLILSLSLFFISVNFMICDYSVFIEFKIFSLNSSLFCMIFYLDWISLLFMSFVLYISSMVIFYSEEYMSGDLYIDRFICLVVMFVLSMMLMIISPNLISILLGWDGLGLVSYCLVIYYQNSKSYNAGMLTALSNRVGDVALLISIAWMMNYGSWNFLFYLDLCKNDFIMFIVSLMIILASITKSAQIPFSSWLPAAMAAPTPVSALVHSSTLVTAGIYLLVRFSPCFNEFLMFILLVISSLTMFMAGLGANFEFDLKKVIALSTLSQLGLMMSILCVGDNLLAYYHLLTHALFKALLFMCAGCMIHNLGNFQDIRFMGSVVSFMPLTCCFFNICNMALCGLPFLSGFYSKDLILEVFSMSYFNLFIYLVFYLSTGLTVCYSVRLSYYTLFGDFNYSCLFGISDYGHIMLKGMGGLILLVVLGGSALSWLIFPSPYFICLPLTFKLMVLFVIFLGFWVGYEFSLLCLTYELKSMIFFRSVLFFSSMWNLPMLSTFFVSFFPLKLSLNYYKFIDNGWSEYFGSQNLYLKLSNTSSFVHLFFKNSVKIYLMLLLFWVILLMIF